MSEGEGAGTSSALKSLKSKRAVLKSRITCAFKKIDSDDNANVSVLRDMIEGFLTDISKFDSDINELCCANGEFEDDLNEEVVKELDSQTNYSISIKTKLSELKAPVRVTAGAPPPEFALKLPELKCESFSGEGTTNLQFHSFISQFDNVIGFRTNLSDSTKFTYLKSYLKGYAPKLIQHVHILMKITVSL